MNSRQVWSLLCLLLFKVPTKALLAIAFVRRYRLIWKFLIISMDLLQPGSRAVIEINNTAIFVPEDVHINAAEVMWLLANTLHDAHISFAVSPNNRPQISTGVGQSYQTSSWYRHYISLFRETSPKTPLLHASPISSTIFRSSKASNSGSGLI